MSAEVGPQAIAADPSSAFPWDKLGWAPAFEGMTVAGRRATVEGETARACFG